MRAFVEEVACGELVPEMDHPPLVVLIRARPHEARDRDVRLLRQLLLSSLSSSIIIIRARSRTHEKPRSTPPDHFLLLHALQRGDLLDLEPVLVRARHQLDFFASSDGGGAREDVRDDERVEVADVRCCERVSSSTETTKPDSRAFG